MFHTTPRLDDILNKDEPFGLGCALELFSEVNEVLEMISNIPTVAESSSSVVEKAYERFNFILSQYQEQPHLLDSHIDVLLEKFVATVRDSKISMDIKHLAFNYMYILIKVRGYKIVVRHLPHEVADFELVLQMLEAQDPTDSQTWMTRYVLLLWLSIIVMIPFHMSRLDGFDINTFDDNKKTVMFRVLQICKTYAVVPDTCRDAAAYLAAKFLIRYDVKQQYLEEFFKWASTTSADSNSSVFVKYGCLASVAMTLKHGKREDLVPHAQKLLQWIVNAEFKSNPGTNVQKLVYKNIQRIGLTFLPSRIATWRYQRGNRSLAANLSAGDGGTSTLIVDEAPTSSHTIMSATEENVNVPDEIEEVIDQLIQGLRSGDSVVRWSAAKGVGRITSRLPRELADDVVGSILDLFSPREGDGAWHGGCLALAELGRRGLLLPQRLPEVVPVIMKALVYDEPRGYSSVGSHIRDAACYVSWSFARAYDKEILKPFVNDIASSLLIVTCFDREINCRRAASAAFQENVGRQGTFPHGIDILTTADFFSVSVRHNSFLNISVFIAQYEEYTIPLMHHLVDRKVNHWDVVIRELTAKALHNLTENNVDYTVKTVLPELFEKTLSIDLNCRHGSVIAIGEIVYSLSKISKNNGSKVETLLGKDLISKTSGIVRRFYQQMYFRGMGGELMRQACCDLIEKCSLSHLPFHGDEIIDCWLSLINECLSYDVINVRNAAIKCLPAFFSEYFQGDDLLQKQKDVVKKYVMELDSCSQISRIGHSLALGNMPAFILKPYLGVIIPSLIKVTVITTDSYNWAESRRDAIKALTFICSTFENCVGNELTDKCIEDVYNTFLTGLTEYTRDNRGDIGAWVREASMEGLHSLTLLLAEQKPSLLLPDLVLKIVTGVAQQAVEKIDRTRSIAGKIFYTFIHYEPKIPYIPNHEQVIDLFCTQECDLLNWNSAAVTFPKFVQLLQLPQYTYNVMLGLVSSVGGLTETLVKNSSTSLLSYLKDINDRNDTQEIIRLCDVIYKIFLNYRHDDRIIISMFKCLNKLMGSGSIISYMNDPDSQFSKNVLQLIKLEISNCKDIHKLIDGIELLCQFLQVNSNVCNGALAQLSILLCHKQSYVRKSTSSKLYEALLVYGDSSTIPQENLDELLNLLSITDWDAPVEIVKPVRNKLCNLMNVNVPIPKRKV